MADITDDDVERTCPFKGKKYWDDLTYCQEFGLCICCPKYDIVIEMIYSNNSRKENKNE